jgi:hypothetical protein
MWGGLEGEGGENSWIREIGWGIVMGMLGRVGTSFHTNKCVDKENLNQNGVKDRSSMYFKR